MLVVVRVALCLFLKLSKIIIECEPSVLGHASYNDAPGKSHDSNKFSFENFSKGNVAVNIVSVLSLACWLVFGSVSPHCYGVWLPCCLLLGGECTRALFSES